MTRHESPGGRPDRAKGRARAIEQYLPLANSLARRYAGRGEPLDDLRQVAALALVRAVDSYDPDREVPFAGYAVPCILRALRRHFRDTAWGVRVPHWVQELSRAATTAIEALSQRYGRAPTTDEIADHLQVDREDLRTAVDAGQSSFRPLSLNAPATGDNAGEPDLIDCLGATDPGYADVDDGLVLHPLLASLPPREQRILTLRYYRRMTQAGIAAEVGLSQMHVSRLLKKSLTRLRGEPMP